MVMAHDRTGRPAAACNSLHKPVRRAGRFTAQRSTAPHGLAAPEGPALRDGTGGPALDRPAGSPDHAAIGWSADSMGKGRILHEPDSDGVRPTVLLAARVLAAMGRQATLLLAGGVFAGLLLQDLAAALRPLLIPSIGVLLMLSVLRLDWRRVLAYARRPLVTALATVWQLVVSPILVWAVAAGIGLSPALVAALVLNAAASPVMSVPAFARLLGLDVELTVVMLAATTLLLPVTLAPMVFGLLSRETAIDPVAYAARAGLLLALPMAAAWAVRRLVGPARIESLDQPLQGLTVAVLLVFAIAVMDGVTARILAEGGTVLVYLAAAFALNLGFQASTALLFGRAGRRVAFSLGLVSGNRNMALAFAVAGAVEPDLLLYLAVAQVPIYVSPLLTGGLYRRLLRPVAGSAGRP